MNTMAVTNGTSTLTERYNRQWKDRGSENEAEQGRWELLLRRIEREKEGEGRGKSEEGKNAQANAE